MCVRSPGLLRRDNMTHAAPFLCTPLDDLALLGGTQTVRGIDNFERSYRVRRAKGEAEFGDEKETRRKLPTLLDAPSSRERGLDVPFWYTKFD